MDAIAGGFRRVFPGTQPSAGHDAYVSSRERSPRQAAVRLEPGAGETAGPRFAAAALGKGHGDLTAAGREPPIGFRILVHGRVMDEGGAPVGGALVEVWQANAAGRYRHERDNWNAPLDPNFAGEGRMLTDAEGRYSFLTVRPGPYPWKNHYNAWRPAHIHFSLFGDALASRLVTQMYFPGDELLAHDPIFNAVPAAIARQRLVASLDWTRTLPGFAQALAFDIVLRGRDQTPFEAIRRGGRRK